MKITLKVAVVIRNSKKEVLLIKEKYKGKKDFKWNLVKGTYDKASETLEDCAKREVREEVGLIVEKLQLKNICHYGSNAEKKILFVFYTSYAGKSKPTLKNIKANENIIDFKWFSDKELRKFSPNNFMSSYIYNILFLKNKNKEKFL